MAADRAAWVAAAREVLAQTCPAARGRLEITLRAESGHEERIVCPDDAPENGRPLPALSPWERDVVRVLGAATLEPKAIATRMGVPYNSQFRTLLYNLRDREPAVVVKVEDGYRRV